MLEDAEDREAMHMHISFNLVSLPINRSSLPIIRVKNPVGRDNGNDRDQRQVHSRCHDSIENRAIPTARTGQQSQAFVTLDALAYLGNLPIAINDIEGRQHIPMSCNFKRELIPFSILVTFRTCTSSNILKGDLEIPTSTPSRRNSRDDPRPNGRTPPTLTTTTTTGAIADVKPWQCNDPRIKPTDRNRDLPVKLKQRQSRAIPELAAGAVVEFPAADGEMGDAMLVFDLVADGG